MGIFCFAYSGVDQSQVPTFLPSFLLILNKKYIKDVLHFQL